MAQIITVFNQKGGVGKTTTVVNLAAALTKLKNKVLVIDMDPQANATSGLGAQKDNEKNIYDLLTEDCHDVIIKTNTENLDLIPSSTDLAGVEIELSDKDYWQYILKENIDELSVGYDYCLIDSPPSLGVLSMMALVASNGILIPVQSEYYALEGVGQLMDTITLVKENFNPELKIKGVVLCMFDTRTNLSVQVFEEVKNFFGDLVFQTTIPRNVRLAEAPSYGMDIFEYDRLSKGAIAYRELAREFISKE